MLKKEKRDVVSGKCRDLNSLIMPDSKGANVAWFGLGSQGETRRRLHYPNFVISLLQRPVSKDVSSTHAI